MDQASILHFDAYVMVDWSANNCPKRGKDSIWYCVLERIRGATRITSCENPATRFLAHRQISEIVNDLAHRGCATLVGFDFPYGYPRGFTQALKISSGEPWREVWKLLSSRIVDNEQNRSNRFEVAAEFNAAISDQPFPFWGCPSNQQQRYLTAKRGGHHSHQGMPEFRFTDKRNHGPQPVWKLCYPGSVGSQCLLGIPYLARLRFDPELSNVSRVWPFETGFELASRNDRDWTILHAEIYPSMRAWRQESGEYKDQAQVRGLAEHFAKEDEAETICDLFKAPSGISAKELQMIIAEEGWILGVK
jgi:hypothetical protein